MSITKQDLGQIKKSIKSFVGSKVKLQASKGRNKTTVDEGIVENVYPSIFIIQLYEGAEPSRKVSYSYTDILTHSVEITLCKQN